MTIGACVTRIYATGGNDAIGASSTASLSAASVAALSVLRSDDEVLLLRVCSTVQMCVPAAREKRPLSRSTDSGSDSADCSSPWESDVQLRQDISVFWRGNPMRVGIVGWERGLQRLMESGVALCVEDVTGEVVKSAGLVGRRGCQA